VSYAVPYTELDEDQELGTWYLLHLKRSFNLTTPYAKAICLPTKEIYQELIVPQTRDQRLNSSEFFTGLASFPSTEKDSIADLLHRVPVGRLPLNTCVKFHDILFGVQPGAISCRQAEPGTVLYTLVLKFTFCIKIANYECIDMYVTVHPIHFE